MAVIGRSSEVSTAEKVTVSAVVSLTVKDAWPLDPLSSEAVVMTALVDDAVSSTVLPLTGLVPSSKVTLTVPVGCGPPPTATMDTSGVVVVTVESAAETLRVPNVTWTLRPVRATPSVVSVAE